MGDVTAETGPLFLEALQATMECLRALPTFEVVRSKSMMLVHRMVLILGESILPCLNGLLEPLVTNCQGSDLVLVVQLMNQLMIKFGHKAAPAIEAVLLPFLMHCSGIIPVDGPAPQVEVERVAVVKLQVLFLQHVASNGCVPALFSARNAPGLDGVMGLMLGGLHLKEAARSTVVFFEKICLSGVADGHDGFWQFAFEQVRRGACKGERSKTSSEYFTRGYECRPAELTASSRRPTVVHVSLTNCVLTTSKKPLVAHFTGPCHAVEADAGQVRILCKGCAVREGGG